MLEGSWRRKVPPLSTTRPEEFPCEVDCDGGRNRPICMVGEEGNLIRPISIGEDRVARMLHAYVRASVPSTVYTSDFGNIERRSSVPVDR